MVLNPYIQGLITAFVYLSTRHCLPKKVKGEIRRDVIAIAVAVAISLLVQFVIDRIAQ